MRPTILLSAFASLATAANVYVDNYCTIDVFLAFDSGNGNVVTATLLPGSMGYTIVQPNPGYINYQVQVGTSLAGQGFPQTPLLFQFSPNAGSSTIAPTTYYSFSTVDGDPFAASGFEVLTNSVNPPDHSVACVPRTNGGCCSFAFTYPGQSDYLGVNLFYANPGSDFTLRLCRSTDP